MLISQECVTAEMFISLKKQFNADFTSTQKLKDFDFTLKHGRR